jgi:hypothetical protein
MELARWSREGDLAIGMDGGAVWEDGRWLHGCLAKKRTHGGGDLAPETGSRGAAAMERGACAGSSGELQRWGWRASAVSPRIVKKPEARDKGEDKTVERIRIAADVQ